MRPRPWIVAMILGSTLTACDSNPTGPGGTAVIVGSIQGLGMANTAAAATGPQQQGSMDAHTVVLGEVSGNGNFHVLAEAQVDAQGRYRLENIPGGRTDLVIQARTQNDAVMGSVVVLEPTADGTTHRAHPINTRSTAHAKVWLEARQTSGSNGSMGAAELALFLDASAPYIAAGTASETAALAQASVQAQQAITASLAAHGVDLSASARNELLLQAAADRAASRDAGEGPTASQQAFITAAFDAFGAAGVQAEALAMAYAAAATSFARASAQINSQTHVEIAREALLLNVEMRKRGAAALQTNPLGLRASTSMTLNAMEARIRAATTMAQLRGAVREERSVIEDRVALAVFADLPLLGGSVEAEVNARTRAALDAARLWVRLNGATTATAMGSAVESCHAATLAAVANLIAALPTSAGSVSSQTTTSLFLILGAGASLD